MILSVRAPSLVCPSDQRGDKKADYSSSNERITVAITSYLGVSGRDSWKTTGGQDGILYSNSKISMGGISDGTSNTLIVGERSPDDDLEYGWQWAGWGSGGTGGSDVVLGVHERITDDPAAGVPASAETDYFPSTNETSCCRCYRSIPLLEQPSRAEALLPWLTEVLDSSGIPSMVAITEVTATKKQFWAPWQLVIAAKLLMPSNL